MMGSDDASGANAPAPKRRSHAISKEWDAGWMMGFSFGALVVVIVHEFPHDFYDAAWPIIGIAGIATFVVGAARTRAILGKRRGD